MLEQNSSWELKSGLDEEMLNKGESFYELLSKHMKAKGWDSAKCYQAAGVDKKLFSKIKNHPGYTPNKMTIIKFAFALMLSFDETQKLLATAGYILSNSIELDIVLKHYLIKREYNLEKVFEILESRSH